MIADERERGDVALAHWLWHRGQRTIEPERLVFVDETGSATNMAPRYGWGPRGERVVGRAPHGRWHTTTFVGGLTANGFIAPFVVPCPMDRAIFETWIECCLVPELPDRAVVVMDNLSSHKGPRVAELIERAGGEVLYLPPYSPDLNPIEQAFAKLSTCYAPPSDGTPKTCGTRSEASSIASNQPSAPTTSQTQDTDPYETQNALAARPHLDARRCLSEALARVRGRLRGGR